MRIEGFREQNLTPNGYDLTIAEVLLPDLDRSVKEGKAMIPSQTWFLVGTVEYLELSPLLAGDLWIRTTWARRGVVPSFGKVDAGFQGNLTLSAFNGSGKELALPIGETFAQVTFHLLRTPASGTYGERSGSYMGQRGVTLSKPSGRSRSGPGKGSTP